LTKDTLPIFASLCGNDKFKINDFPESLQEKLYKTIRNTVHDDTNSITYNYYRSIVNFILNIYDTIENKNDLKKEYDYEKNKLSPLQERINYEIVKKFCNIKDIYIKTKFRFRDSLARSVMEYNSVFYDESSNDQDLLKKRKEKPTQRESTIESVIKKYEGDFFFNLNLNEFLKNKILSLDEQILENFYTTDYNIKLLNSKLHPFYISFYIFSFIIYFFIV